MPKITNPKLRFPEFNDSYSSIRMESILSRVVNAVDVQPEEEYQQIGIRSHGKGLFHKKIVKGVELGNKRVFWIEPGLFIVNIVFAWEQAVSKTTVSEVGMIASHRFPMYKTKQEKAYLDYLIWYFLTLKGKHLLELASPGGAGRNKTLGQSAFSRLKVTIPSYNEQQKIANFLSSVDKKIQQLTEKQSLLQQYKKGIMQKLFSQEIRFKDERGNDFPDWEEKALGTLADKINNKNKDEAIKNVLTNSAKRGIINQTDYFDKSIANQNNLGGYYIVEKNDFVYNPRISEAAPVGPIKRNKLFTGVMSPLYTVFRFQDDGYLTFFELYFETTFWHRYMKGIANYGARHDRMNITMGDFMKLPLPYPSKSEMQKIIKFINAIDSKLAIVTEQIEQTKTFKKGLLQQMFV